MLLVTSTVMQGLSIYLCWIWVDCGENSRYMESWIYYTVKGMSMGQYIRRSSFVCLSARYSAFFVCCRIDIICTMYSTLFGTSPMQGIASYGREMKIADTYFV